MNYPSAHEVAKVMGMDVGEWFYEADIHGLWTGRRMTSLSRPGRVSIPFFDPPLGVPVHPPTWKDDVMTGQYRVSADRRTISR